MSDNYTLTFFIILLLVFLSAFFSASETALTGVSRGRIFQLSREGNKRAGLVGRLREEKESLIGAILLGNNTVNILASALATSLGIQLFGESGVAIATIAMTALVLVFAEVMPKTYAIQHSEKTALLVAPLLALIVRVFSPVTAIVKWFTLGLLKLLGLYEEGGGSAFISSTDAIRGTIELHHREGGVEKDARDMLGSILDLGEIEVSAVMIHRRNVEGIDLSDGIQQALTQAIHSPHSRLPLYRGDGDDVLGVLHMKNLLRLMKQKADSEITAEDLLRIASKPWFVPAYTSLADQLLAFRQRRQHFALVVDEYGALQGIVTLEDIIEEIVGEIDDEHDRIELAEIIPLRENSWLVEGGVSVRDLNRHLDWDLPEEHATTIAGLVIHEARDIPEIGQSFELFGIRATVEAREARQITRLRLERRLPEGKNGEDR